MVEGSVQMIENSSTHEPTPTESNNTNDDTNINNTTNSDEIRQGTITSARFNILSTMVGGGSLSLPLALHQSGKAFLGPVLLLSIAALVGYSIYFLVESANMTTKLLKQRTNNEEDEEDERKKGTVSYEVVACEALGPKARYFSMVLVSSICFFTIAGYGVLLRDMLLPLSDYIHPPTEKNGGGEGEGEEGPNWVQNMTMLTVILLITPLCTLQNLTALQNVGAASMMSVLTLSFIVSYRSYQCNFSSSYDSQRHMDWKEYMTFLPPSQDFITPSHNDSTTDSSSTSSTSTSYVLHELLNALPILGNVFACHFNVIPVYNELQNPTSQRTNILFTSSVWAAAIFYLFMGFSGSMYGNCTQSGQVNGNVLLSFDNEDDVLLLFGRGCLSLTIAFAFPVFVVPARDVMLRGFMDWDDYQKQKRENDDEDDDEVGGGDDVMEGGNTHDSLTEPLLEEEVTTTTMVQSSSEQQQQHDTYKTRRIIISITILWLGAALACCVDNIDIVWDIVGGSFAIMIAFIIPSASFLILSQRCQEEEEEEEEVSREQQQQQMMMSSTDGGGEETTAEEEVVVEEEEGVRRSSVEEEGEKVVDATLVWNRMVAHALIVIFVPFMIVCTSNAVYNIFSGDE